MKRNDNRRYLRSVKKKMFCDGATRRQLLDGLEEELPSCLAFDALCKQFGKPEQIAAELMHGVPTEEQHRARRRRKHLLWLSASGALAVIAALIVVLSISVIEHIQQHQELKEHDAAYATSVITIIETGISDESDTTEDPE